MNKNKEITATLLWYIYAINHYTYQVMENMLTGEKVGERMCSDGVTRKLWEANYELVCRMYENQSNKDLKFYIYKKYGEGEIKRSYLSYSQIRKKRLNKVLDI